MRSFQVWLLFVISVSAVGCADDAVAAAAGPGYWFLLLFIVLPLVVVLFKLHRGFQDVSESLNTLEGQVRRVLAHLEDAEKPNAQALPKVETEQAAPVKKAPAKKAVAKKAAKKKAPAKKAKKAKKPAKRAKK